VYAIYDGWTAGAYRNTLGRNSGYLGYQFDMPSTPFSLTVGVVSGYQITRTPMVAKDQACKVRKPNDGCDLMWVEGMTNNEWMPMLAPSVKFGPARLWWIPGTRRDSVLHLSVEREF
jgi:hypothetical protein